MNNSVSGIKFIYGPNEPKGSRVLDVTVGGKPLDQKRNYKLATNDYLARGSEDYVSLKRGKLIIDGLSGKPLATQVIDYIPSLGIVSPKIEGRIAVK